MRSKVGEKLSIQLLEKRFRFKYLTGIAFENEVCRQEILKRGLEELKNKRIGKKALLFGRKYQLKIESHFFPKVKIKWINKQAGYGLYAAENLKTGSFFGEYTGIVRRNDRRYLEPLNNYCYEYPIPDSIGRSHVIDASNGNHARFINHSLCPNLKPHHVFIDGFFHLIFLTLREIKIGEQLTYNYGPTYWYIRPKPLEI